MKCLGTLCLKETNPEIRAYYYVGFGRAAMFIAFNFMVSGILQFAYLEAGCRHYQLDDPSYDDAEKNAYWEDGWSRSGGGQPDECRGTVYGLKPSSTISAMGLIGGLTSAVSMPLLGSIVDATDHRHSLGVCCAALLVAANFIQIFLNANTWFALTLIHSIVATFAYFGLALVVYAYLPELFQSELECSRITGNARIYEQSGMLTLIIITTIVSLGLGLGVVSTAILAQALAVILGAPSTIWAFSLYLPRKANRSVLPGRSYFVDGILHFVEIYRTLENDFPVAARFLIGQTFIEAATGSLTTAAILILNANDLSSWIGVYLAVVLVCMMFGPSFHMFISRRATVKLSLLLSIGAFIFFFILFVFVATSPPICWAFAPIIGLVYGWYYPGLNSTFSMIVPGGHEGELAGLYLFTSTILSWIPPLIITIFNQLNLLWVGLLSIPLFWSIGAAILTTVDLEKSNQDLQSSLAKRQRWKSTQSHQESTSCEELSEIKNEML